ncbi:MAG: glycosyltransferase family 39 protein [Planctomycetota bacterium]|nr:glycosyltransferase family 39 protein [Planctomycetota bacterium]
MPFRAPPRTLLNILAAGAVLRLATLSEHSLWLDEGATWSWATRPTWGGTLLAEANHPPAWWAITRVWISIFGDSEWALRAPAAILGIVTIWLCWLLGLRLFDGSAQPRRGGFVRLSDPATGRKMALWFAGFVAASTYFIEYAQEARMYALLLAQAVGLSLLYLRWLDRNDRASLVGYALLAAFALYTQYFAIWPILGHAAHVLWVARQSRGTASAVRPWPFLVAVGCAGLLFVPWFLYLLSNYEGISTGEPFDPFARLGYVLWRIGAGPALVVVDRPRLDEGIGEVMAEEALTIGVTAALWFVPIVLGAWRLRREHGLASFVVFNVVVPVLFVLAVFPAFPLVHERYLLFLAPWLFFLATYGVFHARSLVKIVWLPALCVLLGVGLAAYFTVPAQLDPLGRGARLDEYRLPLRYGVNPKHPLRALDHGHAFGKEPWRDAHRFVETLSQPGDLVLMHPWYLHLVWDYYDRQRLERILLPQELLSSEALQARYGEQLKQAERIFLILAHEETEDIDAYYKRLGPIIGAGWMQAGATSFIPVPPILFDRSWGVRVAIFSRR